MIEFLRGFCILIGYFLVYVVSLIFLKRFIRIPDEIFRKSLHLMILSSVFVFLYAFQTWWISALAAVVLILAIYPILTLGERISGYSELLTERKKGELKRSLVVVFGTYAVIISVCWGWLGDQWLVFACIFAWGSGDAAAALVGKRFGRHFREGRLIEGRKSVEGSLAMCALSFVSVLVILLFRGGLPWYGCVTISAFTAAACTAVEMYTRGGFDTATCPLAAATVIIPSVWVWGGAIL